MKTHFTLINGKYISDGDGTEITTEDLMNNEHFIEDVYGWIIFENETTMKNELDYKLVDISELKINDVVVIGYFSSIDYGDHYFKLGVVREPEGKTISIISGDFEELNIRSFLEHITLSTSSYEYMNKDTMFNEHPKFWLINKSLIDTLIDKKIKDYESEILKYQSKLEKFKNYSKIIFKAD